MNKKINVIICGLGAVGCIYAKKFSDCSDINLKILADKNRVNKYLKMPMTLNNTPLDLDYITPDRADITADLIIITTKMSGYKQALSQIKNFVGANTIILPLLNGITSEEIAAEMYGWNHVLYSYFVGHSTVRNNNRVTHDGVGKIVFGSVVEKDFRVILVKSIFNSAKIDYEIPYDIKYSLWKKFLLNICSNPTSALLRLTFGEMQSNQKFIDFAKKIMDEVIEVAKAEGIRYTDKLETETLDYLNMMSSDGKTSMLQDVEAGRKTENEIFAGTVIALGKKHGIKTPYCNFLNEMFDIIDCNK